MRKRIVALLMGAMLTFGGIQFTNASAKAETVVNTYTDADILTDSATDNLDRGASRWYVYYMPSVKGHVNFSLSNPDAEKKWRITVYDSNVQEVEKTKFISSPQTAEYAFSPFTALYVKVTNNVSGSRLSTNYTVSANFTEASDWETDDNNDDILLADQITDVSVIYGTIYKDKDIDYYEFAAPSDGKFSVRLDNWDSVSHVSWRIRLYDGDKQELLSTYGKTKNFSMTTDAVNVKSGDTVYVGVSKFSNSVGHTYALYPDFVPADTDTTQKDTDQKDTDQKDTDQKDTSPQKDTDNTGSKDTDINTDNDSSKPKDNKDNQDTSEDKETIAKPARVTGLSVKNTKGAKVRVKFKNISDAIGYQVWYSYSGKVRKKFIYDTNSVTLSVPKGKRITVKVRAFNFDNNDKKQYGKYSYTKALKTDKK